MSGFTPGPWHIDQCGDIRDKDGNAVVFSLGGHDAICNSGDRPLINSAPDLLEALEKLVLHQEALGRHNTIIDEARAAIASAKGKKP